MRQLALLLPERRPIPRQQQPIDRLRAVLKRMGIDWRYRALRGSVLIRPLLVVRTGYQPMCGFYGCGSLTFERVDGYCDREPLTPEERQAWARWRETEYRPAVHELWGPP
jgi:hypothetical protein